MDFTLLALALGLIVVLYFIFALLPFRVCAICAAVSLTWAVLLAGYLLEWHGDLKLLGILMGSSVVGIMYRMESYFKKKKLTNFWLIRILIIIFGFLTVYLTLSSEWDKLTLVIILVILLGFLSLFFIKSKKSEVVLTNKLAKNLKDKLDHCCD